MEYHSIVSLWKVKSEQSSELNLILANISGKKLQQLKS